MFLGLIGIVLCRLCISDVKGVYILDTVKNDNKAATLKYTVNLKPLVKRVNILDTVNVDNMAVILNIQLI